MRVNYDEYDYMMDCEEERLEQEHLDYEEVQRNYDDDICELYNSMNFLQKMAFEVLSTCMEVGLFMSDDEIMEKIIENGSNDALREFFSNYTTGELLDFIEQTMENQK